MAGQVNIFILKDLQSFFGYSFIIAKNREEAEQILSGEKKADWHTSKPIGNWHARFAFWKTLDL